MVWKKRLGRASTKAKNRLRKLPNQPLKWSGKQFIRQQKMWKRVPTLTRSLKLNFDQNIFFRVILIKIVMLLVEEMTISISVWNNLFMVNFLSSVFPTFFCFNLMYLWWLIEISSLAPVKYHLSGFEGSVVFLLFKLQLGLCNLLQKSQLM